MIYDELQKQTDQEIWSSQFCLLKIQTEEYYGLLTNKTTLSLFYF